MKEHPAGFTVFCSCLALATLVAGCAGYRTGPAPPAGIESVAVSSIRNETGIPWLSGAFTESLSEELSRSGTVSLVAGDEADALVTVAVEEVVVRPVARARTRDPEVGEDRGDVRHTLTYRATVRVRVQMHGADPDDPLADRTVSGSAEFVRAGSWVQARDSGLRQALADAARRVPLALW